MVGDWKVCVHHIMLLYEVENHQATWNSPYYNPESRAARQLSSWIVLIFPINCHSLWLVSRNFGKY